jgi:L-alanine-DL-glutamate epimerase-like enolase superfamily enzyme
LQAYRELTTSQSTPIHTGEQIYSRHNFKELIETQALPVIGPDPADLGGIADLKGLSIGVCRRQTARAAAC